MKGIIYSLILFSHFLSLSLVSTGQKVLFPETRPLNRRVDNFLILGGEANQSSTSIMIDSKGFLWSGTETGLYRFDGLKYVAYSSDKYDSTGFSGNLVSTLFEDSNGNIWVGTSGALNELNIATGKFRHFHPSRSDASDFPHTNNIIKLIREDKNGVLWIMTNGNIFSFDRKSCAFTEYKTDALAWRSTWDTYRDDSEKFLIDRYGNKWFATGYGLFRFTDSTHTFSRVFPDNEKQSELGHFSIKAITDDKTGTIWITTEIGGLFRWVHETDRFVKVDFYTENRKSFPSISAIRSDNDGKLWIYGNKAFSVFDPKTGKSKTYNIDLKEIGQNENSVEAASIFFHKDGSTWFFCPALGYMFRFDPDRELLSLYRIPTWINFQCLMDETGAFWIASIRNNLFRLTVNQAPYNTISILNGSVVNQFSTDKLATGKDGKIWLMLHSGTDTLSEINDYQSPKLGKFKIDESDGPYASVFSDNYGNMWFGGRNGSVVCYSPGSGKRIKYKLEHPAVDMTIETIPKITGDKYGNIWVCGLNAGIYLFDKVAGKFLHKFDFQDLPSNSGPVMSDFMVDRNGDIWILNFTGVFRLKMAEKNLTDFSDIALENNLITGSYIRICEDQNGKIWLLNSNKGLYLFDSTKDNFNQVLLPATIKDAYYFDLLADSRNRLWICNNSGITVFDQTTETARTIKMPQLQYDIEGFLTKEHVIFINEFSLFVFDLDIPVNSTIPRVYLTDLLINGVQYNKLYQNIREIRALEKIDLPYTQNSIRLEFAVLNYLQPEYNKYRFYLKGFDDDTVYSGKNNFAEYKKIPPGKYRFWVSGSNNDGIWNKEGVAIDINIHPPFYRTLLAYFIYFLLFVTGLTLFIRARTISVKKENIKLEKEVRLRTEELDRKNRQLEEMDKLKTRFFTDISHEIRTPLSLILGPLETLVNEDHTDDHTGNLLGVMKRNGIRLTQLVNQMLDISRLDSGKMKIHLAESDIRAFLRILVYEFVSMAESRKIKYLVELPEKPCITFFDRDKLEKIIVNLLSNAFKFTEPGGVVTCKVKILSGHENRNPESMVITVSDTGPGIDPENLEKIFDRFFKVEEHHDPVKGGTGIGLSITKDMVNVLHGKIEVVSERDKGTVFEVSIPLGLAHLKDDEFVITDKFSPSNNNHLVSKWKEFEVLTNHNHESSKNRILIIEDNDDLRNFILGSLEEEYEVSVAENGKIGLNLGISLMPDLIVTDIKMDGIDGLTVCKTLKNDERTSHIPVIILTAKATTEEKIEGLSMGADDYLVKPFNMSELKIRIANLLEQREKLKNRYSIANGALLPLDVQESIDDKFLKKVVTVINERMHDFAFDVRELQEELGMSRMHLFRKLKALTGIPPVTLIRNMRLEKAAKLLAQKSGNITEIANSVGISNPSYFAKCFRDNFGVSPKDYNNGFKGPDHGNNHKL